MTLKRRLVRVYRDTVLPALRGAATPCFSWAVRIASALGAIPPPGTLSAGTQERFLIIHLSNHVGDTVMLLPMIEALRSAHPGARIECVVQPPLGSFLRLLPILDRVHEFAMIPGKVPTPWLEFRRTLTLLKIYWTTIRHVRPTTCIMPRWGAGFRDLMLAYLTQAPKRIGFASNDFDRSQPPAEYRDSLLTNPVRGAKRMTEPERFVTLLEQTGFIPPNGNEKRLATPLKSMAQIAATVDWTTLSARLALDPDAPLAILAPGASAPRRMWPIERWTAPIADLHRDGYTVILLAGPGDEALAESLHYLVPAKDQDRTVIVAGVTSLAESTCLIAHSHVFLGSDSGPGHIAGALGVPCVILFIAAEGADPDGPSAPERVRPMGDHVACCRPAHTMPPCVEYCTADEPHCVLQISSSDVINALRSAVRLVAAQT